MPLITLSFKHGQTLEEARSQLETAVHEFQQRFGALIRHVEWSAERSRVRLDGPGFWVELWVDVQEVHVTGDIPLLGGLLGGPLVTELKQIVQRTFQKQLP
jgi:hypothetical protein